MISASTGSLDEEALVKYMVAGKQTLEKCKLSALIHFAGNIKRILCSHPKKVPAEVYGSP